MSAQWEVQLEQGSCDESDVQRGSSDESDIQRGSSDESDVQDSPGKKGVQIQCAATHTATPTSCTSFRVLVPSHEAPPPLLTEVEDVPQPQYKRRRMNKPQKHMDHGTLCTAWTASRSTAASCCPTVKGIAGCFEKCPEITDGGLPKPSAVATTCSDHSHDHDHDHDIDAKLNVGSGAHHHDA